MSQKFPNRLKGAIIVLAVILAMPIVTMAAPEEKASMGAGEVGSGSNVVRDERLTGYLDLSSESPDQTFYPSSTGRQYMGSGVEAADINGDGIDDIIIGMPGYSSWSGGTSGKIVIYFGMLNVNSRLSDKNANVTITGSSPTFGASVVTADLNGDGLMDLITSAAVANGKRGMVYVFFGKENWPASLKDSNADVIITGMTPPSSWYPEGLGIQIGAGDIDGDGIDDLVASSVVYYYQYDWAHRIIKCFRNGRVMIWFGNTTWNSTYKVDNEEFDVMINGSADEYARRSSWYTYYYYYNYLGSTRLVVADLDGDGKGELIIGSGLKAYYPSTSSYSFYAGEVEILDGKNKTDWPKYVDLSAYNYTRIYSTTSYSYFGSGIAVGDVNGDGLVDIAIGGLGLDSKGAVYLFFGSGNIFDRLGGRHNKTDITNLNPDVTFYGPMGGSETGSNILIADVDGDQYDDILIASGGFSTNQYSYAGRVDLYYGRDTSQWVSEVNMFSSPGDYVITGSASNAWLGGYSYYYAYYAMAVGWDSMAFGDFDMDGKLDFLLGEAYKNNGGGDAVMILYTKPAITIVSADLVDGDGPSGDILTAGFKYYTFRVVLNDTWTWREISTISLSFVLKGAHLGFVYTVEYRAINRTFFDTQNPFNYMSVSENSSILPHGYRRITVEFKVMFSMDFLTDEPMDVKFLAMGGRSKAELTYEDYCRVEMDLTFVGEWVAYDEGGELLPRGAFIGGVQDIYFTGMRVVYENTLVSPPNDFFDVRIVDNWHRVFFNYTSSGADFVIKARSYPISGELRFSIGIVNIMGKGKDVSLIPDYYFTVDADAPTAPRNVVIHSDSFTDLRGEYDNDGEVYVTWDPAYDLGCGIAGYLVKVRSWGSGTRGAAEGWVFTNETRIVITNLTAGLNDVMVAAVDNVGNRGPVTTASVTIETDPVSFYGGGPHQVWKTNERVTVSIHVMDLGGSGVDLSSIEYCYSTSGLGNFGEWISLGLYGTAQDTVVSVDLTLVDGMENYVKFRAKDMAGNGPFESEPINIWVDTKEVSFSNPTPPQSQMPLEEPYVISTITITDSGSGVYGPSIYYSYSTGDLRHYTGWMSANIKIINKTIVASTAPLLFEPGTTNYIKWRAKDVAGNGYTYSEDYPITIKPRVVNHKPVVVIKSPTMNSLYKTTDTISFSAEGTYDPDGDELKYSWYSADWELLSTEPTFSMNLPAGVHVVTLKVDDGEFNISAAVTFTVIVAVEDLDIDHDGMPNGNDTDDDNDGWSDTEEIKMGTDPMNRDTDGDGVIDSRDYDPLNSAVWREPEGKGRVNRLYLAIGIIILLAMLSYAVFLWMAVKKGEEYKKRRLERQAAHLGEFVQRYEQLTGIEAPLLPKVKDLGVELLPAVVQDTLAGSALPPGPVGAPGGAGAPEALPKAEASTPEAAAIPVSPPEAAEEVIPTTEVPAALVSEPVERPPEGGGITTIECELCGTTVEVPPHEGPITVKCPLCGYEMTVQ